MIQFDVTETNTSELSCQKLLPALYTVYICTVIHCIVYVCIVRLVRFCLVKLFTILCIPPQLHVVPFVKFLTMSYDTTQKHTCGGVCCPVPCVSFGLSQFIICPYKALQAPNTPFMSFMVYLSIS